MNKGITIVMEDRRQKDEKGEILTETFHSKEGLKEFITFLDATRESIIQDANFHRRGEKRYSGRNNNGLQYFIFGESSLLCKQYQHPRGRNTFLVLEEDDLHLEKICRRLWDARQIEVRH